jgi:hypothetical protein
MPRRRAEDGPFHVFVQVRAADPAPRNAGLHRTDPELRLRDVLNPEVFGATGPAGLAPAPLILPPEWRLPIGTTGPAL